MNCEEIYKAVVGVGSADFTNMAQTVHCGKKEALIWSVPGVVCSCSRLGKA